MKFTIVLALIGAISAVNVDRLNDNIDQVAQAKAAAVKAGALDVVEEQTR